MTVIWTKGFDVKINRRTAIQGVLAIASSSLAPMGSLAQTPLPLVKPIPSTGERLPLVGLGSWITFNVGDDPVLIDECAAVIDAFFAAGGQMIDSSPMYGSSQSTIGHGLRKAGPQRRLFSADKVWISNPDDGASQIEESRTHWRVPGFDLLQVHNLVSWQEHLETLFAMKTAGKLRYVGVTTSHGRRHAELENVMAKYPIDFVQLTYNMMDREVETRLLPLAQERGIAVIANRPFQRGSLIRKVEPHPLPAWVSETGAQSWPQFLLKFVVSHPGVTCAIPATSRVDHVRENMDVATGTLPDNALRRKMSDYVQQL